MKIGFIYTVVKFEEKLILEEFKNRGFDVVCIDDKHVGFLALNDQLQKTFEDIDIVLCRSISYSRSLYMTRMLEQLGIIVINKHETIRLCGDKLLTTLELLKHDIPTPDIAVAFTPESAKRLMHEIGYPCVVKPIEGSWGKLISKINDEDAAEGILEHKKILGSFQHSIFYVQKYIEKNGKDFRVLVINNKVIGAIYRKHRHWKTNTALGAKAYHCPVDHDLEKICVNASKALGGGILAIDVFKTEKEYLVNEVNSNVEFRNSLDEYKVNIPKHIVDYCVEHETLGKKVQAE